MEHIADIQLTDEERPEEDWGRVLRDVLTFQFKLVVDGLKDLALAQVALGAALLDLVRRDGSPGRRFYGIVRLSDRFDRWLDLHEPLERLPADAAFGFDAEAKSVDDLIDGLESTARVAARVSGEVTQRTAATVRTAARGPARGRLADQV